MLDINWIKKTIFIYLF